MATTTTYGLNTPSAGTEEDTWGGLLNSNFDDIDDLLDGTSQIVSARFTSAAMPADALDPDTGNIQTRTLSANTVFTDALAAGDWLILHLTKGSYTVTWPAVVWVPGDAEPALSTGEEVLSFWKVGSTLYGAWAGPIA
jgi:hypothetical protein